MNSIVEEAKKWVGYLEKASQQMQETITIHGLQSITAITLAKA